MGNMLMPSTSEPAHPFVRIELVDSYTEYFTMDYLVRDPPLNTAAEQAVRKLTAKAASAGAKISENEQRHEVRGIDRYEGGPTYSIFHNWVVTCGGLGAAVAVLRSILPYIREVLKYKAGRSIKVESGDTKISIEGTNDVDKVLHLLHELEQLQSKETDDSRRDDHEQ
jgi:hypothetical protein